MNTREHEIYLKIFYPHGMFIDNNIDEYLEKWDYDTENEKSDFILNLLENNSLLNDDFIKKIKSVLPNGFNKLGSFSDEEFELMKKVFLTVI